MYGIYKTWVECGGVAPPTGVEVQGGNLYVVVIISQI